MQHLHQRAHCKYKPKIGANEESVNTMLTSLTTGSALATVPAYMGHWGSGMGGWFIIFPIFWILLIGALIFLGRRSWHRNRHFSLHSGAEQVLRERYARGEIDETEYRARLEVLRG